MVQRYLNLRETATKAFACEITCAKANPLEFQPFALFPLLLSPRNQTAKMMRLALIAALAGSAAAFAPSQQVCLGSALFLNVCRAPLNFVSADFRSSLASMPRACFRSIHSGCPLDGPFG